MKRRYIRILSTVLASAVLFSSTPSLPAYAEVAEVQTESDKDEFLQEEVDDGTPHEDIIQEDVTEESTTEESIIEENATEEEKTAQEPTDFLEDAGIGEFYSTDEMAAMVGIDGQTYTTLQEAVAAVPEGETATIILLRDEVITDVIPIENKNITIVSELGEENTIKRGDSLTSAMFSVKRDGVLQLGNSQPDENTRLIVDGGAVWEKQEKDEYVSADPLQEGVVNHGVSAQAAAVYMETGRLIVAEGTILQNNENNGTEPNNSGGAISAVSADSHVEIHGIIQSNRSTKNGGAVKNAGTVEIYKTAVISKNCAQENGGAIYTTGNLKVTDAVFSENGASLGKDIYQESGESVYGGDTRISDVYLADTQVLMVDSALTGNIGVTGREFSDKQEKKLAAQGKDYTLIQEDAAHITANGYQKITFEEDGIYRSYERLIVDEQPADQRIEIGTEGILTFRVHSKDQEEQVSYQWYQYTDKNRESPVLIKEEVQETLTINTSETGIYYFYCVAEGTEDEIQSQIVSVEVYNSNGAQIPQILRQPLSMDYDISEEFLPLEVEASAEGEGSLSYQWYRSQQESLENSEKISGADDFRYTPENTKEPGSWYYFVEITNKEDGKTDAVVRSQPAHIQVGNFEARIENHGYASFSEAVSSVSDGQEIELLKDIEVNNNILITNKKLTINGNGHTAKRSSSLINDSILKVSGASSNVTLKNIVLDGGAVWSGTENQVLKRGDTNKGVRAKRALIFVENGTLTIEEDAVVQNNENISTDYSNPGGALYIWGNGSVVTIKGTIANNSTSSWGGAVTQKNSGRTIVEGGHVYGNRTSKTGGAFCIDHSSSIQMDSGIVENNQSGGSGGAIWISDGQAVLNGGTIRNNKGSDSSLVYMAGKNAPVVQLGNIQTQGNISSENIGIGLDKLNRGKIKIVGTPDMKEKISVPDENRIEIKGDLTGGAPIILKPADTSSGEGKVAVADTPEQAKAAAQVLQVEGYGCYAQDTEIWYGPVIELELTKDIPKELDVMEYRPLTLEAQARMIPEKEGASLVYQWYMCADDKGSKPEKIEGGNASVFVSRDHKPGINYYFCEISTSKYSAKPVRTGIAKVNIKQFYPGSEAIEKFDGLIDYKVTVSEIQTMKEDHSISSYFEKQEAVVVTFKSSNAAAISAESAQIKGEIYKLVEGEDGKYQAKIPGFSDAGLHTIQIEKIWLENGQTLDLGDQAACEIETLKDRPTAGSFAYSVSEEAKEFVISFTVSDEEKAFKSGSVQVVDGENQEIYQQQFTSTGHQEFKVPFSNSSSNNFRVLVKADYDLDSDHAPGTANEYKNVVLLSEPISAVQGILELKDITSVKLYTQNEGKVEEVKEIDEKNFNPDDYIAQVTMKDLPVFYGEIESGKVKKDGSFWITLKYDYGVHYEDGIKKDRFEVKVGESSVNQKEDSTYIPELSRLEKMENFNPEKTLVYHNMYKLIPFFDAKYLVEYGNQISSDNLMAQKPIKYVLAYNENKQVTAGLTTESYDKLSKIKVVYETGETQDYSLVFDKKIEDIAIYKIPDLGISYTYNNYILDAKNNLLEEIYTQAKELDYKTQIAEVTAETESRLYVDYYNESVSPKLENVIQDLMSSYPQYNIYLDNEILKAKIKQDMTSDRQLEKILYAYNYFDKWYHFEMEGTPLTTLIFFNVHQLNPEITVMDLVTDTLETSESDRATKNTVNFYNSVIKKVLQLELSPFLEYFIFTLTDYEKGSDWFTDNFKGILVEKPIPGHEEDIRYRAWDLLKSRNHPLLAILSAPQERLYIISVPSQLVMGSTNRYSSNLDTVKKKVENYAVKMQNFYSTSSSFISNSAAYLNRTVQYQYDTSLGFPNGNQETGKTQDPVIKWVYEALGVIIGNNGAGAFANGSDVYWVIDACLNIFRTFSHETAHNQDGAYFYEGNGRRAKTWVEDHADGNITQDETDGTVIFNLEGDKSITSDLVYNLKLDSIAGKEKIYNYYKGMYETTYVLDYLAGQAFLKLSPMEQAGLAVQATYPDGGNYDTGGEKIKYDYVSAEKMQSMDLQTMSDLWDNGLVLTGSKTVQANGYRNDNYYSIYWYQPHNDNGRPDHYSFKLLGFEMLGYAGYSDGYVTYRSGKSSNDLDALRKITGNPTITWKEYKMQRYKEVEENLSKIPYFDAQEIIDAYVLAFKKDAQTGHKDRANVNNLRKVLYGTVKRATKDFQTGSIYSCEQKEISTAQELIDVLNKEEWGSYILTQDIDFSEIQTTQAEYISNRFVGKLNGDNHKITGLKKPLFKHMTYGEIENLTIESPQYDSSAAAVLANTSRHIIIQNVEVKNSNKNLPLVKTDQGVVVNLGSNNQDSGLIKISTVEDLLKIGTSDENKMKSYILTADLDVGTVTDGDAIIPGNFTGTIDGDGHTISNLKIPLIGNLLGTVSNLKLKDVSINQPMKYYVGALASTARKAIIEKISIENASVTGSSIVGGMIGNADNIWANKISLTGMKIQALDGWSCGGGAIGSAADVDIKDIVVSGELEGKTTNGGVIGYFMSGAVLDRIYADMDLNTSETSDNGGLFGDRIKVENITYDIQNIVVTGNMPEKVYKITDATDDLLKSMKNVYEYTDSTGMHNADREPNIQKATTEDLHSESFYTEKLGMSSEDWDFSNIASTGIPVLR